MLLKKLKKGLNAGLNTALKIHFAKYALALRKLLKSDLPIEMLKLLMDDNKESNDLFFPAHTQKLLSRQIKLFNILYDYLSDGKEVSVREFMSLVNEFGLDGTKPLKGINKKQFVECKAIVVEKAKEVVKNPEPNIKYDALMREAAEQGSKSIITLKDTERLRIFFEILQKDLQKYIRTKSGLCGSYGLKIMSQHEIARDLLLCHYLNKRMKRSDLKQKKLYKKVTDEDKGKKEEKTKDGKTKIIYSKETQENPAFWMSFIHYYLKDPLLLLYLKLFAKEEWSLENLEALDVLMKYRLKSKITKSQIKEFIETFGINGTKAINTNKEVLDELKKAVKDVESEQINLWDKARDPVKVLMTDCVINFTDTFSRARYTSNMLTIMEKGNYKNNDEFASKVRKLKTRITRSFI